MSDDVTVKCGGVVDENAAIEIAFTVLTPIFGRNAIEAQKPYRATLDNGVWSIEGSLPQGSLGGTAHIEISAKDGAVTKVWQEQ